MDVRSFEWGEKKEEERLKIKEKLAHFFCLRLSVSHPRQQRWPERTNFHLFGVVLRLYCSQLAACPIVIDARIYMTGQKSFFPFFLLLLFALNLSLSLLPPPLRSLLDSWINGYVDRQKKKREQKREKRKRKKNLLCQTVYIV